MSTTTKTMTLNLPEHEMEAIASLATRYGTNKIAIVRAAMRYAFFLNERCEQGDIVIIRDRNGKESEFLGRLP